MSNNIDLGQFFQVFFDEAAEHLSTMEAMLLRLDVAAPGIDDLNAIFRSAHSIKGGAGTFGFTDMTEVTHVLESLLDRLRKQEMILTDEMVTVFLEAGDVISSQLAAHRGEGAVNQDDVKAVRAKLERLATHESAAPTNTDPPQQQACGFFDEPESASAGRNGTENPGYGFFTETPVELAEREVQQGYGFFQELPQAPAVVETPPQEQTSSPVLPQRRANDKAPESSIRVSVEKVDQLINLAGELVITQAMLLQSALKVINDGEEHLRRGLHQLERNTRDLQEAVMSIRMLPISFVFSRFPRLVRDLAGKLNKQVELKTVGENTELDKGLIEKIADPMTHLVRNSLDHGIESPEKRIAAGKDPRGNITLKAFHQGGNVVIEVSDDGGGLSRSKILAKARERGLPASDDMPDEEVWGLIMAPGFSTAETVTDLSGRGVGMDVVKRNIAELGGRLDLDSVEGYGSRFTIRLPLTLAILDGLSVSVGEETYIIPLNAIVESLQASQADLKTVTGKGQLLQVRGEYLPLLRLHEVFNTQPRTEELEQGITVIVEAENRKTALFVDELLGQHQVVIKSLEPNFRKIRGISGATIMGDGRVALILDVTALARTWEQEPACV